MNLLDNEMARASSGQRPKLPVLFHLLDVSRPRSTPLAVDPPAECIPAAAPAELLPAPMPAELPPVAPLSETAGTIAPTERPLQPEAELPAIADSAPAIDPPTQANAASPSPSRSQSERRRKARTPASEEWFTTHGKYIAIAFVVALAATIYFARTNRRTPPVANSDPPQLNIERGDSSRASSEYRPDAAKSSTTVVGDTPLAAGTNPTSPARLIETTSANAPQAELFPPTAPSMAATADNKHAAQMPAAASPAAPPLVAARSDVPAAGDSSATSATSAASVPAPAPAASADAPAPPALEPNYPTTGYPTTGLPAANYPTTNPLPPPSYPVTTYQPAFGPQPGPQIPYGAPTPMQPPPTIQPAPVQPVGPPVDTRSAFVPPTTTWTQPNWQSPPPPGGQPAYSPSVNPAPGTRYERSGSGLYQGLR
jgi:hypothetical protein